MSQRMRPPKLLDFGCGKGRLFKELQTKFPSWKCEGYDPAIPEFSDIKIDSEESSPFNIVCAMDVLEHFDPEDMDQDLELIRGLSSDKIIVNISCRPAVAILPDGRNAHTALYDPIWWMNHLHNVWPDFELLETLWNPQNQNLFAVYSKKLINKS